MLRRHWLVAVLLVAGAVARLLVLVTFRPALDYLQDSYDYLLNARRLQPGVVRPLGYPLFLRVISSTGRLGVVPLLQHVFGLVAAVLLYTMLLRLGVRRWLAGLGVAPLLLDAYQIDIEQFIMAEALFQLFLSAAVALLLWHERPSRWSCLGAGVLLAAASLTRTAALAVLAPAGLLLLFDGAPRWRVRLVAVAAGAAGAAVLLLAYAGWFNAVHARFALQASDGHFLAGRMMPIADCTRVHVPGYERPLCDPRPPMQRPSSDWYDWQPDSPLRRLSLPPDLDHNDVAGDFARRVIRAQPADVAGMYWHDLVHYFWPGRHSDRQDDPLWVWQVDWHYVPDRWYLITAAPDPYHGTLPYIGGRGPSTVASYGFQMQRIRPRLWIVGQRTLARFQHVVYTPGPLLGACFVLGTLSGVGRLHGPAARRLRAGGIFLACSGSAVLALAVVSSVFDYRYLLATLPLLPPAGACGIELTLRRLSPRLGPSLDARSQPAD